MTRVALAIVVAVLTLTACGSTRPAQRAKSHTASSPEARSPLRGTSCPFIHGTIRIRKRGKRLCEPLSHGVSIDAYSATVSHGKARWDFSQPDVAAGNLQQSRYMLPFEVPGRYLIVARCDGQQLKRLVQMSSGEHLAVNLSFQ